MKRGLPKEARSVSCIGGTIIRKLITIIMTICVALGLSSAIAYAQNDDTRLLARLIESEASGEPFEGKIAVANVVLNRVKAGKWGDSISAVIYARNQFAKPKQHYSEDSLNAAKAAILGAEMVPNHVLYFQRAKVNYFYGDWVCTIGEHNFYG